jgi:hypothetical protein
MLVYVYPGRAPEPELPLKVRLIGVAQSALVERNVRVPDAPPVAMVRRAPEKPHGS